MKKNLFLLVATIIIVLILIGLFLKFFGPYNHLANTKLVNSISWYERPSGFIQAQPHPDLNFYIKNIFDNNGIKRCNKNKLNKTKNLIGIFGDSFVENISVKSNFEYSCLINSKLEKNELLNFGIGGYNFEQAFARYLKYQKYNFKYVIYLFNLDDQKSIGLIHIDKNNQLSINKPKTNYLIKILSKLNITYLLIDFYYHIQNIIKTYHYVGKNNFQIILSNQINKINIKTKNDPDFKKKIIKFNDIVKNNGGKFIILIYPNKDHINYFKTAIGKDLNKLKYFVLDEELANNKNYIFKHDAHWNEYGNVFFAKNLLNIFSNLGIKFIDSNFDYTNKLIKDFYLHNVKK